MGGGRSFSMPRTPRTPMLVSPGCWRSRVKVARIYLCPKRPQWAHPQFSIDSEVERFESEFRRLKGHFGDIDFVVNEVVTDTEQAQRIAANLNDVDGILAIHLSLGVADLLSEILKSLRPTILFAAPSSADEWVKLDPLRNEDGGALLDFILTNDLNQLAPTVRPFRAIHHLREAKIINVSAQAPPDSYVRAVRNKFGTEIVTVGLDPVMHAYQSISQDDAETEMQNWISGAESVSQPPHDEILRSARLALAFEKLLDAGQATVLTVDCYGSMYRQLPAYPCMGFVRLNNIGLGGICESDLDSAIAHIALQGLSGKPGFISAPEKDEAAKGVLRAQCLGSLRMDGPGGTSAPYTLRPIQEQNEGCVPEIRMRLGQRVTQAHFADQDRMFYFTGRIVDISGNNNGCRSNITLEVDGDSEKLSQNWSRAPRRTTVYGNLTQDLRRFCRFKEIKLVNEA
jgi:hypothetical protein